MCAEALSLEFNELCEMAPDRIGQDSCYWLDSSQLRNDTGWEPIIDWKEGLDEMVSWGKKYIDQLSNWPKDYTFRG